MKISQLFGLELQKNKTRKNFLFIFALLIVQFAFIANGMSRKDYHAEGWLMQFYNMPLLNAIFLPTLTAVLASRNMDLEHKGSLWKTLYTLVSPAKLFFAKLLYGMTMLFSICVLQSVLLFINGTVFAFDGNPSIQNSALYFISTFSISFILYFIHSLLSFVFENQVISISIGLIGSLAGMFLMYIQDGIIQRLLPWGLYGASMFARMDWNPDTRVIHYYTVNPSVSAFVWISLWIIALVIISVVCLKKADIDGFSFSLPLKKEKANSIAKPVAFSLLPPELLKIKTSYVWLPLLILPCISALIGTFNYVANIEILKNGWYDLWSQHTLFLGYFFLPAMIGVVLIYLWRLEHNGTNWNQLFVQASPFRIIMDKFLVSWGIAVIGIFWIIFLFLLCGKLAGISSAFAISTLADWVLSGILGMATVCAAQLFISLVIRNFAAPVGIGIAGGIVGLLFTAHGYAMYLPYSLLCYGMRANNPLLKINHLAYIGMCLFFIVIFLLLSSIYLKRSDVKTQE